MEAKDTVMSPQQVQKILDKWNDIDNREMAYGTNARPSVEDFIADVNVKQAEITWDIAFKAGYDQARKEILG